MRRKTTSGAGSILEQRFLAMVVALLGWAAVAGMMLTEEHGLFAAEMVLPAALSLGLIGAFSAGPALARSSRRQRLPGNEPSYIRVRRPARDYFSPYACCPPDESDSGGDPA